MTRVCYLHIGTHKTASTSIQVFLANNHSPLRECGYTIPQSGLLHNQHEYLVQEVINHLDKKQHWQKLSKELGSIETPHVIISSEYFSYLFDDTKKIDWIISFFEQHGFRVHPIVCLRKQSDYANSLYRDLLRGGLAITFQQFIQRIAESMQITLNRAPTWTQLTSHTFNYHQLVSAWFTRAVGSILLFENMIKNTEQNFLHCVGINPVSDENNWQFGFRANEANSQLESQILFLMNVGSEVFNFSEHQKNAVIHSVQQSNLPNTTKFDGWIHGGKQEFQDIFDNVNHQLARNYNVDLSSWTFVNQQPTGKNLQTVDQLPEIPLKIYLNAIKHTWINTGHNLQNK